MAIPSYLRRAVDTAREIRSRYFSKADSAQYQLSSFLKEIFEDEGIKCEPFPFAENEIGGYYSVFAFGPVIVYNATMLKSRQLFTVAHELGHHFLHRDRRTEFTDLKNTLFGSGKNPRIEMEANAFAAELVVPFETLVVMLDRRYPFGRITESTGASLSCLKWRVVSLLRDEFHVSKDDAVELAEDYRLRSNENALSEVRIFRYVEENRMLSVTTSPSVVHVQKVTIDIVAVCTNGSPYMKPEVIIAHTEVVIMAPDGAIELDENKRFKKCPQCGNEHFSHDAQYCMRCGLSLFNRCTNESDNGWHAECGKLNVAEARFCEYCGSTTYLAEQKLLKPWRDENNVFQLVAVGQQQYADDPFADDDTTINISDDDLPF